MNVDLVEKDKMILKLLKYVNTITNKVNELNTQLEEAKSFGVKPFWSGFYKVFWQA